MNICYCTVRKLRRLLLLFCNVRLMCTQL